MKTIFSILKTGLILLLILYSCSSEEVLVDNNPIIGSWIYESAEVGEVETNSKNNSELIKPYIIKRGDYWFNGFEYVFKPYGKLESSRYGGTAKHATYTFSNGLLTATIEGGSTQTLKAKIVRDILIMEHDVTDDCNDIKIKDLLELGIDDINFNTVKAIAIIKFRKQQ